MIGRRPRPIPSHSLLSNLPPVPRLTRYQHRQCILSQREYVLNHIDGDLGLLEYPIRIVVSDRPHLVYKVSENSSLADPLYKFWWCYGQTALPIYEASLEDLIEPTKEVVIAFMYIAKNSNNVFRSRTLPHGVFE